MRSTGTARWMSSSSEPAAGGCAPTTGRGVGVADLAGQSAEAADAINWDREVDVVVIGAGAGGLVAAIAAREKGASVLIVEKNFDIGGGVGGRQRAFSR